MGARFITGQPTTVYKNKPRTFATDRPGICHLCTREYAANASVVWDVVFKNKKKCYRPVHPSCLEWKNKARGNKPTTDGGYDVPPSPTKLAIHRAARKANNEIDKNSGLAFKPIPGGSVVTASTSDAKPARTHKRKPNKEAERLVAIERFKQSHQ